MQKTTVGRPDEFQTESRPGTGIGIGILCIMVKSVAPRFPYGPDKESAIMPKFKIGDRVERIGSLVPIYMQRGVVIGVIPNKDGEDWFTEYEVDFGNQLKIGRAHV